MSVRVVSALERQHREVAAELRRLFSQIAGTQDVVGMMRAFDPEISRLRSEIEALETVISTFSDDWSPEGNLVNMKTPRSPFKRGELRKLAMAIFREQDRFWSPEDLLREIVERHLQGPITDWRLKNNLLGSLRAQLGRDYAKDLLEKQDDPERWRLIRKSERGASKLAPFSTAASAV